MTKRQFAFYAIPNVGDPVFIKGFGTAAEAETAGCAAARLLLCKEAKVGEVEVVVLRRKTHVISKFLNRSCLENIAK